jgi:Domain of unknown function (DUF4189)
MKKGAARASVFAVLGLQLLGIDSGHAEGALAIGMPEGNPAKGFRHAKVVNDPNAGAEAMKDCRNARNPKTAAACSLIGTFKDQCVAVAVNGDAVNQNLPIVAAGWAIAWGSATASREAIAKCEAMRKGQKSACQVEGKVLCDGKAK